MAAGLYPRVAWSGVLALVLAACAATPPPTYTLEGTMLLTDPDAWNTIRAGDPCEGQGGYEDIVEGAQVVVRDGAGEILATGALDAGVKGADEQCSFAFAVERIPDADFYGVEVSHRGELAYSREDMEAADWRLSFTLGD